MISQRLFNKAIFALSVCVAISCHSPKLAFAENGTYPCELSGMPVSENIKDRRPIAVMMDNEQKALPHASLSKADIVYEMANSTANGRITRLMCFYKDYGDIDEIGSVRSMRLTHIPIAAEYDAILIHEGGPEIYISKPLANSWATDLNGGFSRLKNGKALEFTEFVLKGEVESHAAKSGVSLEYDNDIPTRDFHFNFGNAREGSDGEAELIDMSAAYPHTKSKLAYDSEHEGYVYYTYGQMQQDKDTGDTPCFDNVIIQFAPLSVLDQNGYMFYSIIGKGDALYITKGKMTELYWKKESATGLTKYFYKDNGKEAVINPGKTYINIYPEEYKDSIVIH